MDSSTMAKFANLSPHLQPVLGPVDLRITKKMPWLSSLEQMRKYQRTPIARHHQLLMPSTAKWKIMLPLSTGILRMSMELRS